MNRFVAVLIDGELTIHLPDVSGNYATLCGIDGDDPDYTVNQIPACVPRGAKVNCRFCGKIFELAKLYSEDDFDNKAREKGAQE